jgi:hypothetical protein
MAGIAGAVRHAVVKAHISRHPVPICYHAPKRPKIPAPRCDAADGAKTRHVVSG